MLLAVCSSIPTRPPKDIKDDIFILRQRASAILQSKEGMPLWDLAQQDVLIVLSQNVAGH
jgi:hypothetical protein